MARRVSDSEVAWAAIPVKDSARTLSRLPGVIMRSIAIAICATGLLVSCGSDNDAQKGDFSKITFSTGEFEVPPGDSFECFYTNTTTPRELGVNRSSGTQVKGGHHITVYYTDIKRPAEHHPCVDAEMATWHMVAGTGGDGAGGDDKNIKLPEGFAMKVPAGKQIVIQAHYINTTGKPYKANDSVTLELIEAAKVKQYANYVVANNDTWTIPAKSPFESVKTCTIKNDLKLLTMLGHMHELGKHYKLEMIDTTGKVTTLYEQEWEASFAAHPPLKNFAPEAPFLLPKGTKLRQTCKWDNDTTEEVIFPREMCIFFGYYYPDQGELFCENE